MKVTILQGAFLPVPPLLGGAVEKMWFALGKEFAQLGHEVIHVSRLYNNLPKEENIDGVLHKRYKGYSTPSSGLYLKWLDFRYTARAVSAIARDTDIVITNTFWAPVIISSKLKERCIVDVQRMPKGQMKLYKGVACLRANSKPVAEAIRKEISSINHNRVVTIPNPLPFQQFSSGNSMEKKRVILYAGRIHPEKGLELLIQAFKMLAGDWLLRIVGPSDVRAGGGGDSYLQTLKSLAGQANICFMGPVYDMEQLNGMYAEASLFVYPSVAEHGETFGLAPLEAMAWGCVPVVSNLTCFQDFITHENNGMIFNHRAPNAIVLLQNTLERLALDIRFQDDLRQEALKVRFTHSTSYIASRFLEMFGRVLEKPKRQL